MPIPLLAEQRRIAAYLDGKTSVPDPLIADRRAAIDFLLEYRTSLISEAVTGTFRVSAQFCLKSPGQSVLSVFSRL